MGAVDVKHTGPHELTLEWESSASNDMIADSSIALIIGIDRSPASVKCKMSSLMSCKLTKVPLVVTTQPHAHRHPHALGADEDITSSRIQRLSMFLESHFGDVELHTGRHLHAVPEHDEGLSSGPRLVVNVDGTEAIIDLLTLVSDQIMRHP
jgi:cleavage and polyadenylation specificity factor subunit 3